MSVAELTPEVLANGDAFLAWDQGNLIPELKAHLSILASRAPIIAIADRPSVRQVASALVSGAVDFLEWPCSSEAIRAAVASAMDTAAKSPSLAQRATEARRRLERLSGPERQVLAAMAQGKSNKAIAEILEIEPWDVEIHRRNLLAKIEVEHSAEAIRLELEASLSDDWNKRSDWMAPWRFDNTLTGTH